MEGNIGIESMFSAKYSAFGKVLVIQCAGRDGSVLG